MYCSQTRRATEGTVVCGLGRRMSVALHRTRNWSAALDSWQRLLSQDPRNRTALWLAGLAAGHLGAADLKAQLCRQAEVGLDAEGFRKLAEQAQEAGEGEEGLALLRRGVQRWPALMPALARAAGAAGKGKEAVEAWERVVQQEPANFGWWANLATARARVKDQAGAEEALARAIRLCPEPSELYYNLGTLRLETEDLHGAVEALEEAIRRAPGHIRARLNRANGWRRQGRLEEAVAELRALEEPLLALTRGGDQTDVWMREWSLASALLQLEQWEEGWARYEVRRRLMTDFNIDHFHLEPWDGQWCEALLVHAEQGLGDTIQFFRYVSLLEGRVGRVVFRVQDRLWPLLKGFPGVEVLRRSDPLPRLDREVPLLSLPYLLRCYVPPSPVLPSSGAAPVSGGGIGLGWQGNRNYKLDYQRSIPFRHLAPLLSLPLRWRSLQYGEDRSFLAEHPQVEDLGAVLDQKEAFVETAALLPTLDRVITSDTALAHLAGSSGVPTFLLLAHVPDWRWGTRGEQTPWYPNMRLFRQEHPGDWDGVIRKVRRALE